MALTALIGPATKLIGKFVRDKDKAAQLSHDIATMAEKHAQELALAQIKLNTESANMLSPIHWYQCFCVCVSFLTLSESWLPTRATRAASTRWSVPCLLSTASSCCCSGGGSSRRCCARIRSRRLKGKAIQGKVSAPVALSRICPPSKGTASCSAGSRTLC